MTYWISTISNLPIDKKLSFDANNAGREHGGVDRFVNLRIYIKIKYAYEKVSIICSDVTADV